MDFVSLQHLPVSEVHWSDRFPGLSSFRLQGLLTLLTAYSLRNLVSLIPCSQRSWDSPLRSVHLPIRFHSVSRVTNPLAVPLTPYAPVEPTHGSVRRGSWTLPLTGSLGSGAPHTVRPHQVAPLGFSFLGFYRQPTLAPLQGLSSLVLDLGTRFLSANVPVCTSECQSVGHWKQPAVPKYRQMLQPF